MNRAVSTFTKGIATGMVVGTAMGMITRPMDIRKRARMKKNTTKALRAVGEIIANAQNMMR